jgi:hypothetical protein
MYVIDSIDISKEVGYIYTINLSAQQIRQFKIPTGYSYIPSWIAIWPCFVHTAIQVKIAILITLILILSKSFNL